MEGLIQQDQELTEEILKNFIAEKENAFQEGRKAALVTLKKKENCLRQQDAKSEEANVLSKAAVILEGIPMDKLMAQALLDKKSLVHAYNNSESTAEQRAVFQFASNPNVKPSIVIFRGQHPNWKKAKKHLLPKMEQNNDETPSDGTNGIELDEGNAAKSKKKSKKKRQIKNEGMEATNDLVENEGTKAMDNVVETGKAQENIIKSKKKSKKNLERKNEGTEAMDTGVENNEAQENIITKSKKKSKKNLERKYEGTEAMDTGVENDKAQENIIKSKKESKKNLERKSEETEVMDNGVENDEAQENIIKSEKKSKKHLKRKNEGTDVIDDGVGNGKASPKKKAKKSSNTSSLSMTEELDDSKKGKKGKSSKKKLNAIEKMMNKTGEELESEQENARPQGQHSKLNARPQGQHGKFHRKNNTSSSQIQFNKEDKSNGFTNGNQGKSNGFTNGNQGESNGFDNGKQSERDGFANGRQSYGFDKRRQRSTDRMSNYTAQRNKPLSLNKIRRSVPGDSANLVNMSLLTNPVPVVPKIDGEQKSSLLRPVWLTNPEDYVPEPMTFVKSKPKVWFKNKNKRGNKRSR